MPLHQLAPRRVVRCLAAAPLLLALATGAGCKKKDGDSDAPGGAGAASAEEIATQIKKAKDDAKVAGLVDLANKDLKNGRYLSAAKRAEEALADDENNADAWAIIGASRWRAGDFAGSTEAYETAIGIDDKNYGAALGLSTNWQTIARDSEVLTMLDKVLAEDPDQVEPRLRKVWSLYSLTDADGAVKETDEIFTRIDKDDPLLPLVQAYAAYMRPLAGKGPFHQVSGSGKTTLGVDPVNGIKFVGAVVGDEFTQAVVTEIYDETQVDPGFVKAAGLKSVGKFKPLGSDGEVDIVIIPVLKFGDLEMKNVPGYVTPLDTYAGMVGETPGLRLGRHALRHLGTQTYDYAQFTFEVSAETPSGAPDGATEAQLLMVGPFVQHAPVVPIKLAGSEHTFYAYLGGLWQSGLSISKKHYLKSGYLPRHVEPPDDVDAGLKMVYVDGFEMGGDSFPGCGGLVLVNEPPTQVIADFLNSTSFEIGGFVNQNMLSGWRVTYVMPQAKIFIERK